MKKNYRIGLLLLTLFTGNGLLVAQTKQAPVETLNKSIEKTMDAVSSNISYMENKGQWYNKVLYQGDFHGGRVFLEKNALTYVFLPPGGIERVHPHPGANKADFRSCTMTFQAVRMEFQGCNQAPSIDAADKRSYYCNYFVGNDKTRWASNVGAYGSVYYNNLYPGVSVKVFSDASDVRYDFIVDPNTSVSQIKLHYQGQNTLSLNNDGKLVIHTEIGDIAQSQPIAYQEINGAKVNVDCGFVLNNDVIGFVIKGKYDASQPLIIDPTLVFSTFTGSTADNWGMSATYDALSDAYTSGICFAIGYPVTPGAYMMTFQGGGTGGGNIWPPPDNTGFDIVVSKFNPTGTSLLFSTYLGGSDNEEPQSLVVDNQDNLIVLGRTYSTNFPTTPGAFQSANGGGADLILSKFDSTGTVLMASTYIGGSGDDGVNISALEDSLGSLKHFYADDGRGDVVVDANNNVYVASCTKSPNFPVTPGAFQTTPQGLQDGCAFRMNSNLTAMTWCTYLGGSSEDAAYNIALNSIGEAYVVGGTSSINFPTTGGTLHTTYMGNIDGFIIHLSPFGTLLQSSYLGTPGYDQAYFVQTDKYNNVYVYGQTSGGYPISAGVYSNANSGQFIHEMNPTLSSTVFSTEFGSGRGYSDIAPSAFLVDQCLNIYISGWGGDLYLLNDTNSSTIGLPVTSNAYRATPNICNSYYTHYKPNGEDFYFMVLQRNASALWYATYFGATSGGYPFGSLAHVDGGTSRFDKRGVIYQAICGGCGGYSDIPTTTGAWSATNDGPNCNNALVKFQMDLLETVASFIINPATATGCLPFPVTFSNTTSYGQTYKWYFGTGDSSLVQSPTYTYTKPGVYNVMLVAVDSTTCNMTDSAYATVRVLSPLTLTAPNVSVCLGDSVTLKTTTNRAFNFSWTPSSGLNDANIQDPSAAPLASAVYYVTAKDSFCTVSDTVHVSVFSNVTTVIPNNSQLCMGDSISLVTDSVFSSYIWSTGATTQSIEVKNGGTYFVQTVDKHGCKGSDSAKVEAFTKVPLTQFDTSVCLGNSIQLRADSGNYKYLWEPPFGLNSNTIWDPVVKTYGSVTYTLTVTNGPCVSVDSSVITVKPTPWVKTTPDSMMVLPGQVVTLDCTGTPPFTWTYVYGLSCTDCASPTYKADSNHVFYVQVADSDGCKATDSVIVDVLPTMYIPNAFTPNHDGLNDIFQPKFTGYVSIEVWIFDRWGQLIYKWNTLNGGWDGTVNGVRVQEDTYVYQIRAVTYYGTTFQKIGSVTVIR